MKKTYLRFFSVGALVLILVLPLAGCVYGPGFYRPGPRYAYWYRHRYHWRRYHWHRSWYRCMTLPSGRRICGRGLL